MNVFVGIELTENDEKEKKNKNSKERLCEFCGLSRKQSKPKQREKNERRTRTRRISIVLWMFTNGVVWKSRKIIKSYCFDKQEKLNFDLFHVFSV